MIWFDQCILLNLDQNSLQPFMVECNTTPGLAREIHEQTSYKTNVYWEINPIVLLPSKSAYMGFILQVRMALLTRKYA